MRRKGTPCACECDPCRGKNYVRAVNNVSPDPNGDLELRAGNGIAISQSGDNQITITNDAIASSFVAGDNIEINPVGNNLEIRVTDDVSINNLNVAGDIIQQGAAYETHAEKVYTTNDYIYMRDGAIGGLAVGSLSGFEVIKYDGSNNGRLAIDKDGVARVGDVGDEQPLLTRDEAADLTDGALLKWDASGFKAVKEGNVGSDTKPVKIVNGVATPVTNDLALKSVVDAIGLTGRITEIWDSGQGHIAIKFTTVNGYTLGIEIGYVTATVPVGTALLQTVTLHNSYTWFTTQVSIASANAYFASIVPTIYKTAANTVLLNIWNNGSEPSTQAFSWMIIGFVS